MNCSLAWLNTLLDRPVTSAEAEHLLTFVGFPIESVTPLPSGDVLLDVEVTSNRGDCLSHLGLAREVAAASGRRVVLPCPGLEIAPPTADAPQTAALVNLENRLPGAQGCPLFTLRVIRGVRIAPSPAWLQERLIAIGQRPINNVVDATNYVAAELGNPSHVFDLASLAPGADGRPALIIRTAQAGERLTLLDGKTVTLAPTDLVVADAQRARSLAGIMGGQDSGVRDSTSDVVVEVATWTPGLIRKAARRLQLRSEASHRFERFVDPRTLAVASARLVQLITQLAGGSATPGLLAQGAPIPAPARIRFRPDRARHILGAAFDDARVRTALCAQQITCEGDAAAWACTPPDHRPDLRIEEDLIEEVARTVGLEQIPVHDRLGVRLSPPQTSERAVRELTRVLTGLGFDETVTFSFIADKQAKAFVPAGLTPLAVSDERRKGEGTLRPSLLPSLLQCRRANQDRRSAEPGAVRLFELASTFAESAPGQSAERRTLALLLDVPAADPQTGSTKSFDRRRAGVRLMRGAIEALLASLHGPDAPVAFAPGKAPIAAFDESATALVSVGGKPLGAMGLLNDQTLRAFELEEPVVAAELDLATLLAGFPPRALVQALPQFPAAERDINIVMDWSRRWSEVEQALSEARGKGVLKFVERWAFVSLFPDPLKAEKKRVLMRLVFRDPAGTLTSETVEAQMAAVREHVVPRVGQVLDEYLKQQA
jgi:phenylalanyl-tRNA synthetase beta chain